jgi:hypothetical protein
LGEFGSAGFARWVGVLERLQEWADGPAGGHVQWVWPPRVIRYLGCSEMERLGDVGRIGLLGSRQARFARQRVGLPVFGEKQS